MGIYTLADLKALHGAPAETLRARLGNLVDVSLREGWFGQAAALLKKKGAAATVKSPYRFARTPARIDPVDTVDSLHAETH